MEEETYFDRMVWKIGKQKEKYFTKKQIAELRKNDKYQLYLTLSVRATKECLNDLNNRISAIEKQLTTK